MVVFIIPHSLHVCRYEVVHAQRTPGTWATVVAHVYRHGNTSTTRLPNTPVRPIINGQLNMYNGMGGPCCMYRGLQHLLYLVLCQRTYSTSYRLHVNLNITNTVWWKQYNTHRRTELLVEIPSASNEGFQSLDSLQNGMQRVVFGKLILPWFTITSGFVFSQSQTKARSYGTMYTVLCGTGSNKNISDFGIASVLLLCIESSVGSTGACYFVLTLIFFSHIFAKDPTHTCKEEYHEVVSLLLSECMNRFLTIRWIDSLISLNRFWCT
jgi:hypothetical protein